MKTEKKYKLTDEVITVGNKKLYRIESLKDFADINKGDKGGFVESEDNLSQTDDCWVYNDAMVYGNAMIFGDAKIYGNAKVFGDSEIFGNASIYGKTNIFGNAAIFGNVEVYDNVRVYGKARIYDNAKVYEDAEVYGEAYIYEDARVYGEAWVYNNAKICENANVYGNAWVYGKAEICGNAKVLSNSDYIVFKNWWSSGRYFTWTKSNNMWKVGCFYGTGEELIKKAYKDSKLSGREYKKAVKYVESILRESNTTIAFNKVKQCLTKFIEKFKLC